MKNHKIKFLKILIFFLCAPIINTNILAMPIQAQAQVKPVPTNNAESTKTTTKLVTEAKVAVEKDSCRICLTEFEPEEKISRLKCHITHIFHEPCINEWYTKSRKLTCPLCRASNTDIIEAFKTAVNNNDIINLIKILEKNRTLANYMINPVEKNTILHYAAAKGLKKAVQALYAFGADLCAKNLLWEIPLHLAAAHGHRATAQILCSIKTVNARDQEGNTPLHRAAAAGWVKTIEMLIGRGADKNCQTCYTKYTPLHCAVISHKYLAVQTLLEHNVDPGLFDWQNKTPIHYAILFHKSGITTLLLKHRLAGF